MPKVIFKITPAVIHVSMKEEGKDGVRRINEDGGLVQRFLKFKQDEYIDHHLEEPRSGAGFYSGFFSKEDAEKIEKWLLEQGAERSE